jgi:hypothetical protein
MDHGSLDEGEEGGVGRPELGGHLFREGDRNPEAAGGCDGEPAPVEDMLPALDGAQEDRLEVQAEEEGARG